MVPVPEAVAENTTDSVAVEPVSVVVQRLECSNLMGEGLRVDVVVGRCSNLMSREVGKEVDIALVVVEERR